MQIRTDLKNLYSQRTKIQTALLEATEKYIEECGDSPLLYITEHAIVRYLERVKGKTFDESLSDADKLRTQGWPPEKVREQMLTKAQQLDVVKHARSRLNIGEFTYIIKNLSVITVTKKRK